MKELLEAERALSLTDQSSFDGWLMAKAKLCIRETEFHNQPFFPIETRILKQTKRMAVLFAEKPSLELTVTLLNAVLSPSYTEAESRPGVREKEKKPDIKERELRFIISDEELAQYLKATEDTNPIHYGAHSVLPGLCLMNRIIPLLSESNFQTGSGELRLEIRFLRPVYVNEAVIVTRKPLGRYQAFVGSKLVFTCSQSSGGRESCQP